MKRCRICGGTGIIYDRNIQAGSHGELRVCDCIEKQCLCGVVPPYQVFDENGEHSWCSCRSARLRLEVTKKAFKESQIPKRFQWKFIWDFDANSPETHKFYGTINSVKDMTLDEKFKKGIYLWGPPGSGKTLIACIFLNELMLKHARGGRFVDISRQFFQRLRSSYDATEESYGTAGRILDELIEIPFLVIDDFGTQRNTEWESEMLYNLIDSRYEEERLTIITSNLSINKYRDGEEEDTKGWMDKALKKKAGEKLQGKKYRPIDIAKARIYSRIIEMCRIINVDLPDYRENLSEYI